jgi:hypothetical protein
MDENEAKIATMRGLSNRYRDMEGSIDTTRASCLLVSAEAVGDLFPVHA